MTNSCGKCDNGVKWRQDFDNPLCDCQKMLTIHKQTLEITDEQFITVPEGSELLTVQIQNGAPQIWYKCDTEAPKVSKRIRIYGTGNSITDADDEVYLATFQVYGGSLVFHVFVKD